MVPAASPARLALIAEALVPEPRLCTPVLVAPLSELLVAYRNQNCVAAPLGLTVPPSVAELLVTKLAAPVVTVGATMAALTWKLYFAEESEPLITFTHQVRGRSERRVDHQLRCTPRRNRHVRVGVVRIA